MTAQPVDVVNLGESYDLAPLPWERVRKIFSAGSLGPNVTSFVGTVRPDGRPHSAGVGVAWYADQLHFTSGPNARKARNLAANPACTVSMRLPGIDVVLEGDAHRVTDQPTLDAVAALYRAGGWPATVAEDGFVAPFSAPSAGPPPWHLYRLTCHTAFGVATEEPSGATRWRFS